MEDDGWEPSDEMMAKCYSSVLCHKYKKSQLPADILAKVGKPPNEDTMKFIVQLFTDADANQDQLLDLNEWISFRRMVNQFQTEKMGGTIYLTDKEETTHYHGLNSFSPEYEGLALNDLKHWYKTVGMSSMKEKFDTEYRVWYFPGYGRAESLRQALACTGCTFTNKFVQMNEWMTYKSTLPGGSLPALEHKDGAIKGGSTQALVRFICMKHGLYPDDPMTAQQGDMIADAYQDVFGPASKAMFGVGGFAGGGDKVEPRKEFFGTVLPKFLTFLEPYCNKGQFLIGPKVCYPDFFVGSMVFGMLNNPHPNSLGQECKSEWQTICAKFPGFHAYSKRYATAMKKRFDQLNEDWPY